MNIVHNVAFNDFLKDATLFNSYYLKCLKSKITPALQQGEQAL
jgi:hypothetical protein